MMRNGWKFGVVLLGLLGLVPLPSFAEVSVDISENGVQVIILGLTEGPDPWGMIWVPYRDIEDARILNPDGSARGDGRPDVTNPDPDTNIVVWSYQSSGDHDIAFSEWTGSDWSAPIFLTSDTTDEMDPRVLVTSNGNVHVAWWVKQTKRLYLATRLFHSNLWGLPREIEAPLGGARPSLVEFDSRLHVAYERFSLSAGVQKDIFVARRSGAQSFDYIKVGESQRSTANDPVMHVHNDIAWVDWKHNDDLFGYVVYDGGWGQVQTVPWPDSSWVGEEDVRLTIRGLVLSNHASPYDAARVDSGTRATAPPPVGERHQLPFRERRDGP